MPKLTFKKIVYFILFFLGLELLSFLGYFYPYLNKSIFVLLLLVTFFVSLKNIKWGVYIVLAELILGSKGYLFYWDLGSFSISIRLALFLVVFIVWFLKVLFRFRDKKIMRFFHSALFKYYLLFLIIIFLGGILGFLNNDFKSWFLDINGFLYLGLLPVFYAGVSTKEELEKIFDFILVLCLVLSLKTLFLLYIFSHQITDLMPSLYRWVRISGWGEITASVYSFYRIFSQSHIFLILGIFLSFTRLFGNLNLPFKSYIIKQKENLILGWIFLGSFLTSYSRSLWLGFLVSFIFLVFIVLFVFRLQFKEIVKSGFSVFFLIFLSFLLLGVLINFPYPKPPSKKISGIALIQERVSQGKEESAFSTRLKLLSPLISEIIKSPLIGFGFGKTITFKTDDPRFLAQNPTGIRTTYAFEWGWLDIMLKIGIIGLFVFLVLLFQIGKLLIKSFKEASPSFYKVILLSLLLTLVAEITLNTTTPYLNHPLGLGLIILMSLSAEV